MTQEAAAATQPFVMDTAFWVATTIFILAYAVIVSEKIHKTIVAVFGAGLMLILKILQQHEAFHVEEFGIDWNVIFLLISMMVIINLMRPTGVFEYIAIKSAKLGKGEPFRILVIFAIVTATLSALLDNVTTVLLIVPVTILIADALEVDPLPYLISCALASNIGGTATLIGDPPNIMIASKAQLNFMDFIYHLSPVVVVIMVFYLFAIKFIWGKKLKTREELKQRIMSMNENEAIKDPVDAMRASKFPVEWATAAFFLSFFGFAAKAGVVPLHVWLPEAHPVAPSNVSALMSGVMLKTAIYGIIRITFDLIKVFPWWWGAIVLVSCF